MQWCLERKNKKNILKEEFIMPKIKTKRAAAKRFTKTGTGKLKRNKAYESQSLTRKATKRKRHLTDDQMKEKTNVKTMKKILPYV